MNATTTLAIHDDACGEMLVDGFCHRCNLAPDRQSVAIIERDAYIPRASLAKKVEQLEGRRDELLAVIRRLSTETPYAEEIGKIGVLMSEIGTLRGEVANLRESIASARDFRAERDAVLRALGNFATAVRTGNLDSVADPDDAAALIAAMAYLRGDHIPPLRTPLQRFKKET